MSFLLCQDFGFLPPLGVCAFVADCRSRRASSMDEQRCGNPVESVGVSFRGFSPFGVQR